MNSLKKIFDIRSKTFIGVMLGVLAILLDSVPFFPKPPSIIITIMQIVAFLLTAFGLFDAAEQSQADIIKKVKDFFMSSFGAGVLLEIISHVIDKIVATPDAPAGAMLAAQILGAVLMAMGLRNQGAKARLTMKQSYPEAAAKYKHLLEE